LISAGIHVPKIEYYHDQIEDDAFAELAWPDPALRLAILVGDQTDFAPFWRKSGWTVITLEELQAKGASWLIDMIMANAQGVS
jgi:DEAD/DEAH box helicase domain-containing protein